jgi:hypothetical protein
MSSLLSRRDLLRDALTAAAGACGALAAAPMINLGRFRLFAHSTVDYSARAIRLVRESLVVDMLNPFSLDFPRLGKWQAEPERFTAADFQRFRDSGIDVFHIATRGSTSSTSPSGRGGRTPTRAPSSSSAGGTPSLPDRTSA